MATASSLLLEVFGINMFKDFQFHIRIHSFIILHTISTSDMSRANFKKAENRLYIIMPTCIKIKRHFIIRCISF